MKIEQIKNLPSPKGHLILGHLPQFNVSNKHLVLEIWVEECGDIFKINFIGKEFIVSAKPELNTEILKLRPEKFRRFSKINEILAEMGIVGVFNAEGETWKKQRKPSSEALNLKKVKGYYPTIRNTTEKLIHNLTTYTNNNIVVDIQKELSRYAIDITTAIAFGHELNTLSNKENDFQNTWNLFSR